MTTTPKIKLTYFDIEGVAEPIRLAFILGGVPFEDDRIAFSEWGALKPKTPAGSLPVMTIDDGPMKTQSGAMLRWAATLGKASLNPTDKVFEVEEAMGIVGDMQRSWMPSMYMGMRPTNFGYPEGYAQTEEGKAKIKEMRQNWVKNELPKYVGYLSDLITKNGGTWLCGGENPTIADCFAVPALRNYTRGHIDHVDTDCIEKIEGGETIIAYLKRFCSLEGVEGRYTNGVGSA